MKIEIQYERFNKSTYPHTIAVSHNGNQWSCISVSDVNELRQLRDEIDEYIATVINRQTENNDG